MIRFIVYDSTTGVIQHSGTCRADDLAMQAPAGCTAMEHPDAGPNTHKVAGGVVVEYTELGKARRANPPGVGFAWDPSTEDWVDERALAQMQSDLLAAAKRERDSRIEGGFVWDGSAFDSDSAISQPRLLGLFTTALAGGLPPEGYPWRLADNTWRVLSAADAAGVWGAFQSHMAAHFAAFAAHESAILAETDIEALQSYDLAAGWPT